MAKKDCQENLQDITTSLNRVTFAFDTLREFISLSSAKQKILLLLLGNRNMREKPLRPSHYFSYSEIAERTGLKEGSVRVLMISLDNDNWVEKVRQRKKYTVDGRLETQHSWSVIKVILGLAKAYADNDEVDDEAIDTDEAPGIFLHDGKFWRQGGELGWQSRKQDARLHTWSDTMLAPDPVIEYFDGGIPDAV